MKNIFITIIFSFITIFTLLFLLQIYLFEPALPLKIPTIDQVEQITIIKEKNGQDLFIIKNPIKINSILKFIQKHNNNWESPLGDTMPVYPYSAIFTQNKQIKLVIWLGNGSLGARDKDDSTSNRLRPLSSQAEKQLFDLIGILYRRAESSRTERYKK